MMAVTRKQPETKLHRAVAGYLDLALPRDAWWTTFPAGGGGGARGGKLKSMGLKPGVPDILILYKGNTYWIELKSEIGRLSKPQLETQNFIIGMGGKIQTCRSVEDVENALRVFWNVPLRAITRK